MIIDWKLLAFLLWLHLQIFNNLSEVKLQENVRNKLSV